MSEPTPKARVIVYEVAVAEEELGFEPAGPLFERYTVGLTGRIDRRWVDCYRKQTAGESCYSGFRLEPAVARVSFVCHRSNGPAAVMSLIGRLKELVDRCNSAATTAARLDSAAASAEPEREEKAGAVALLSRWTRGHS